MENKTIKKSYFMDLFNKGMKVEEMAKSIQDYTGIETNLNDVRKIAKTFNINLKTKPRGNKFKLVNDLDLTLETETEEEVQGFFNTPNTAMV